MPIYTIYGTTPEGRQWVTQATPSLDEAHETLESLRDAQTRGADILAQKDAWYMDGYCAARDVQYTLVCEDF